MSANNPFSLNFGKEPDRFVERTDAYLKITDQLNSISPSQNTFMVTGVRGSGKTVLMTSIANEYREKDDWVVVSLNSSRDLLEMLAATLYENQKLQRVFISAKLNLSRFGIGLNIEKVPPVSDIQIAIEKMASLAKDNGTNILITIDDITKSNNLVAFANAFQDLLSKGYPVFLIMTGLYENVYALKNDKRCSFLVRAEEIRLKPLSIIGMKNQYQQTFQCGEDIALQMATFTKGYSFAFQVLGYIAWEKGLDLAAIEDEFDERMATYFYEKIWDDLSEKEKEIVMLLVENGKMKTKDMIEALDTNSNVFSVQKNRLIKKGIVDNSEYGLNSLMLPRFSEFVKLNAYEL